MVRMTSIARTFFCPLWNLSVLEKALSSLVSQYLFLPTT